MSLFVCTARGILWGLPTFHCSQITIESFLHVDNFHRLNNRLGMGLTKQIEFFRIPTRNKSWNINSDGFFLVECTNNQTLWSEVAIIYATQIFVFSQQSAQHLKSVSNLFLLWVCDMITRKLHWQSQVYRSQTEATKTWRFKNHYRKSYFNEKLLPRCLII